MCADPSQSGGSSIALTDGVCRYQPEAPGGPDQPECAAKEVGLESWEYLKRRLAELRLLSGDGCVYRTKANCLRVCEQGPIAVVYPDGIWYHSATPEVIERIIQEHLIAGRPVADYMFARSNTMKY